MPSAQYAINYPTIEPKSVPDSAEYEIARMTINSIRRYLAQPGIQERFEAWKRERGMSEPEPASAYHERPEGGRRVQAQAAKPQGAPEAHGRGEAD